MWQIFQKEVLELLRDKKTLIFVVLLPTLLMPLLMTGFVLLAKKKHEEEESKDLHYVIYGAQYFSELAEALEGDERLVLKKAIDKSEIKAAIREGRLDFALVIPDNFGQNLESLVVNQIELHFNDADNTNKIFQRVDSHVEPLMKKIRAEQFQSAGFEEANFEALLEPVNLKTVNVADKREDVGEKIGGLIPYFFILICFSGAMYPAIDIGVGEKERGTLETLLLTPLNRVQIVLAKTGIIFTTAILSVFLSLFSMGLWIVLVGPLMTSKLLEFLNAFGLGDFVLMFVLLLPVALIFSSLLLSLSIYAKSFKEAQSYMSPLMMVILVAVMVSLLPGIELNWNWAMVPITNVALAMKEVFKGTVDFTMLAVIFSSTLVIAGVLTYLSTHWFNRESVLFRT